MSVSDQRQAGGLSEPSIPDLSLHALFQPIVELCTGVVVGYEALARGVGPGGQDPEVMLAAARAHGRVVEWDWAARWAAVGAAREGGLRHPMALFINAEPEALGGPPGGGIEAWAEMGDLRCYTEITERALAHAPGALLRAADAVRAQDWGIALDDIGATPQTLALMPMLQPDVLKLDLTVLREHRRLEVARVLHAVLAHAGDTGACVVAEGIETEAQRDLALGLGVRLGQGYWLGRPGPLPTALPPPASPIRLLPRINDRAVSATPYTALNDAVPARRVPRAVVETVWAQLEGQAAALAPAPIVLAAFPDRAAFTTAAAALAVLSRTLPLVAALGPARALDPAPGGLRLQVLPDADPASDPTLVVISPYYAAALCARPVAPPAGPGDTAAGSTEYDLVVSFARPLVVRAATALMSRLDATPEHTVWLPD